MSSLGAPISAGDGGGRGGASPFLPANGELARGMRVNPRLSPQKRPVAPQSPRDPELNGEKHELTGEDASADTPALNGPSLGGKGWVVFTEEPRRSGLAPPHAGEGAGPPR